TIAGLGTDTFRQSITTATEIYGAFNCYFQEGIMNSWSEALNVATGALTISNRYLTATEDTSSLEHIPFDKAVDPKGYLSEIVKRSHYIHTDDNVVEYFKRVESPNGEVNYEPMLPQSYRLGDIVKIQLLFQTVSVERNAQRKMLAILRAVTLLDGSFKPKKTVVVVEAPLRLKRKVGHNFGDKSSSAKSTHEDELLDKRI
ncbi:hypothetical protein H0H81_003471, partial [Sphagnurus paluster]